MAFVFSPMPWLLYSVIKIYDKPPLVLFLPSVPSLYSLRSKISPFTTLFPYAYRSSNFLRRIAVDTIIIFPFFLRRVWIYRWRVLIQKDFLCIRGLRAIANAGLDYDTKIS